MLKKGFAHLVGQMSAVLVALLGVYFAYLLIVTSDQTRLAVLTAAVSVGTLIYTSNKNTKREVDARQFSKKAEAYEEIMITIFEMTNVNRKNSTVNAEDFTENVRKILPKLMIWAGPEVLSAWSALSNPSDLPLGPLIAGNNLIAALRKELGHSNDASLGNLGLVSVMIKAEERESLK